MGFFDNIFRRGRAYTGSKSPVLACEMTIEGHKYLLEEFDLDLDTSGGKRYVPMYATFAERLSPELEAWITMSGRRKDGVVKFYRNIDRLEEGAVFTLSFHDAACVRYNKTTRGDTPLATLVLTAQKIRVMDEAY
jgi:hypothetical protein